MNEPKDTIWWRLVNLNPVLLRGGVSAIFAVLVILGVRLSPDLSDKILLGLPVMLAIAQALWSRASVTPNAKVAVSVPDPINAPSQIEAGEAVVSDSVPAVEIRDAARSEAA